MTNYNIYQLKQYANKFLKDNYGMELSVPLRLNARMQRTCGWFKHRISRNRLTGEVKRQPTCVELNKFFVENNEPTLVLDVLRHELVHYALYMLGKPNKDGHPVFENELKRLGVVSQSTINKYNIESKPVNVHIYECDRCGIQHKRQRALPNGGAGYRCSCKGSLIDKGKKLVKM